MRIWMLLLVIHAVWLPAFPQFAGLAPGVVVAPVDEATLDGLLHATRAPLLFAVDDVLTVRVLGVREFAEKQRVADDGTIVFPLAGRTTVEGVTVAQLQEQLAQALRRGNMVREPQVSVEVEARPSAVVTVSGDVVRPGVFPAYGRLTVMDYLSEAGGINENQLTGAASGSPASVVVTLIRPSLNKPVEIPLGPDARTAKYGRIVLFPGDEVRVGRLGLVYAVGAFKNQGGYALKSTSPTTAMQLVALAGGIGYEAAASEAHIVRTEGGVRSDIMLDVGRVMRGQAPDVALRADDILYVPTNEFKAAIKGGGTGLIVSLASAYLYAVR
jgi:polysaccharide export outer membrane protein